MPPGAHYLNGGTFASNGVSWTVGNLAPSDTAQVSFVVTATATLINSDYRVSATGGYNAVGSPVVTILDPSFVYLPIIRH